MIRIHLNPLISLFLPNSATHKYSHHQKPRKPRTINEKDGKNPRRPPTSPRLSKPFTTAVNRRRKLKQERAPKTVIYPKLTSSIAFVHLFLQNLQRSGYRRMCVQWRPWEQPSVRRRGSEGGTARERGSSGSGSGVGRSPQSNHFATIRRQRQRGRAQCAHFSHALLTAPGVVKE